MKKSILLKIATICFFSFVQMDCTDEPIKPCTDCPPPIKDTIITFEKELCNGQMPAVSPDGSKIAYTFQGDIWLIDTAGIQTVIWVDSLQYPWIWHTDTTAGKPTQLTFGPEVDVMPRWNPNGQTIGFIRSNQGEYNKGLLFIVPVTGGGATQLVFNQFVADSLIQESRKYFGGANVGIPIWDWSPNGKYSAFFSSLGYETHLNVVSITDGALILNKKVYEQNITSNYRSFVWSSTSDEIYFISGSKNRYGAVHGYNILTQVEIIDSTLEFPGSIARSTINKKVIYVGLNKNSETVIIETDLKITYNQYVTQGNLGLKWSVDEKNILYELPGTVGGPLGYTYSRLFIFNIERRKDYMLTDNGDNDLHNYFFEWGKNSQDIYFERFNKINKTVFHF